MSIRKEDIDNIRIIKLCTRIDVHNVFTVEEQIIGMIDQNHNNIIIDFKDVEYFGSNGIRILMLAKKKLSGLNGDMVIINLNSFVTKILRAVDLLDVFSIVDTQQEAINILNK